MKRLNGLEGYVSLIVGLSCLVLAGGFLGLYDLGNSSGLLVGGITMLFALEMIFYGVKHIRKAPTEVETRSETLRNWRGGLDRSLAFQLTGQAPSPTWVVVMAIGLCLIAPLAIAIGALTHTEIGFWLGGALLAVPVFGFAVYGIRSAYASSYVRLMDIEIDHQMDEAAVRSSLEKELSAVPYYEATMWRRQGGHRLVLTVANDNPDSVRERVAAVLSSGGNLNVRSTALRSAI